MKVSTPILSLAMLLMLSALPLGDAAPCTRQQGCEFWDDQYHEYILNDVDTPVFDVIIIPGTSAWALRDISTIEQSIQAWENGIKSEAASWLASVFEINIYTLGYDEIPLEALWDPEVIVISGEVNPFVLFGIGYALPISICWSSNPFDSLNLHQHEGSAWASSSSACEGGGHQCIAINTNFFHLDGPFVRIHGDYGERRMYDLVAHEFGHCLGIGHVGDALDFDAKTYPSADIMSYQYDRNQVFCVSNLNVRSVEGVMAKTMGRPTGEQLDRGDYYHMNPADYRQVSCNNPDDAWELPV